MNKVQVKGIAIVVGTIFTFLLMGLLRIQHPIGQYFSGWNISYAIIATLALIFGAIVGGAIGLFSTLLVYISQGFYQHIIELLPNVLAYGLYGFIIGKIFEKKSIDPNYDKAIGILGIFSLSAAGLYIAIRIISSIILSIGLTGNISLSYLPPWPPIIIQCLIIGVVGFLLAFVSNKCLKMNIPLYAIETLPKRRSCERVSADVKTRKEYSMLDFVRKSFRGFFEFWLWLNLIFFVIIGGVCGNLLAGRGDHIFVGLIVGAIIGLIIDILGGGLIATFLEMSEDIKKIAAGNVSGELPGGKPIEGEIDIPPTADASPTVDSFSTANAVKESYVVQQETKLYKKQGDYTEVVRMLIPGENVSYFKSGNTVSVRNITAPMFYIKTGRGELGWCFSGFLK